VHNLAALLRSVDATSCFGAEQEHELLLSLIVERHHQFLPLVQACAAVKTQARVLQPMQNQDIHSVGRAATKKWTMCAGVKCVLTPVFASQIAEALTLLLRGSWQIFSFRIFISSPPLPPLCPGPSHEWVLEVKSSKDKELISGTNGWELSEVQSSNPIIARNPFRRSFWGSWSAKSQSNFWCGTGYNKI
jgi:hypothetical protein